MPPPRGTRQVVGKLGAAVRSKAMVYLVSGLVLTVLGVTGIVILLIEGGDALGVSLLLIGSVGAGIAGVVFIGIGLRHPADPGTGE